MATNSLPGYRNVRASAMVEGGDYSLWLHNDSLNDWNHCKLVSRPTCSIKDMTKKDRYVFRVYDKQGNLTDREIILVQNGGFPAFLITHNTGITGRKVQTRLTIIEKE